MTKRILFKCIPILFGIFMYAMPNTGYSQVGNIAPQATITGDGTGGGGCRPVGAVPAGCGSLNDLNLGSCGTQQMWISTATPPSLVRGDDYIQWDFPNPVSFDTIVIHHAQTTGRFLTGATIQYWDGAAWIDHFSFSGLPQVCVNRIAIGRLTTDRFRMTSWIPGTGQQSNMNFREIEIIASPSGSNDAAVLSVDSPRVFCAGTENVIATIANLGINQLDSVDVEWEVNNIAQPTFRYIGLLDTAAGTLPFSAQVTLGTFNFPVGSSTVKVWTTNPNGGADTSNFNDTALVTVQTAIAPPAAVVTNTTLTTATATLGNANGIDYVVVPFGTPPTSGTVVANVSSPFTATGLTASTLYDLYVRKNCGGANVSAWVGPTTFNTAYGIPFFQDFELFPQNVAIASEGWTNANGIAAPSWRPGSTTGSFGTGPVGDHTVGTGGTFIFLETSSGAGVDTLYSPPIFIDTILSTIELEFWYHMHGATMGDLEVYADTNGVQNLLVSYVGQQHPIQTNPWLSYSAFLNGYNGKTVTLKFVGVRGTGFTSDMAIDDVRLDPVLPLDAGVTDVIAPSGNICPGNATPIVEVRNFGSNVIDSVKVLWDINGVVDSVNYIGTIAPGARVPVTLGTVNFNATTVYNITFSTKDPNGATDMFAANDALTINGLRTGVNGAITLNPALAASATNFIDFASLESALNNYGVCGPTTVTVSPGVYNETIQFDNVPGTSPTNTLTIDGGDTTLVTLENNLANTNVLVEFKGSHYITVKNMTIRSTYLGTLDHSGVHFNDSASYDSLVGCRVLMNPNATFNSMGVAASQTPSNDFSEGNNAWYNVVMNNRIEGGDYSIHFEGGTGTQFNNGNQFIGNTLINYNNYGMYLDNQNELVIRGNDIRLGRSLFGDAIAAFEPSNFEVNENKIVAQDYGIWLVSANSFDTSQVNRTATVINNMVSKLNPATGTAALEVERGYDVAVIHNSVYAAGTVAMYFDDGFAQPAMDLIDCRNNIFKTDGSFALQIDDPDTAAFTKFDNNLYNTAGPNAFNIDFTTYVDLVAYQTAQPLFNTASLEGDPVYASTTDLHIVGTLANDTGDLSVNVLVDIDGDVRPSVGSTNGLVDLGADEFDPPTCPPPSAASINYLSSDSVSFNFTANTVANDVEFQVVTCGTPVPTVAAGFISNTGIIGVGGLSPETCYEYYYREICGRGDTSQYLGPIAFNTECAPFAATYSEGFETPMVTGVEPDCWTSYATYNQANAWARVQGFGGVNSPRTGSQALYIYNWFGYTQGLDTLAAVSPRMSDLTNGDKQLRFWAKSNAPVSELIIATAKSATPPHQFTLLDTLAMPIANTFQEYIVLLDSARGYNGTDEYFALLHSLNPAGTFDYIIVDDFNYEDIPSCPKPSDQSSSNATLTSVDLDWVDNAGATNWEIVWGTAGTGLAGGTSVVTTTKPYSLTGLTASTTYEFYVRAICAVGDSSAWEGPFNAFTANGVPYLQDFELFTVGNSVAEEGWINRNGTLGPNWQVNTQTGSFGTGPVVDHTVGAGGKFIYLETSTGAGVDTLVSPPIYFNPSQGSVTLEYWYHMHGAAMGTLEVYADTNGVLIPLDTFVGQQHPIQTDPWLSSTNVLTGLNDKSVTIKFVGIRGTSFTSDMAVDDVRLFIPAAADGGVSDIITPVTGCGLTANDTIEVEITNYGTGAISNFPVNYEINAGTPVTETFTGTIGVGLTDTFRFATTANLAAFGTYTIEAYTSVPADGDATNDETIVSVDNIPQVGYPYFEDFETTNGGWTVSGANASWAWGAPTGTYINAAGSGTNAWVTNLSGDHNNNELSYLVSPCIDLSGQTADVTVYFNHIFETETNFDEGWMEQSIDGGQTWTKVLANAAQNWYNNTVAQFWETANVSGTGVWDTVINTLTGSASQANFRLRFVMSSDGSVVNEGFGVDSFAIGLTTGINEATALVNGFSVSPNPSEGLFTLRLESEKIENLNVTVRDLDGKTVYEDNISVNGTYREDIDLTNLAKGVYFMQVMSGDETRVEKLVIQ